MIYVDSWAEVVLAASATATAIAAGFGVGTWRKTLVDTRMHDAGRNLLIATYKIRDAIEVYRDPFIPVSEQNPADIQNGISPSQRTNAGASAMAYVYNNRNKLLREIYVGFSEAELVAEALWADDAKTKTQNLLSAVNEARRATNELIMRLPNPPQNQVQRQEERELRSKISGRLGDAQNPLSVEITVAIGDIEDAMRKVL